MPIPNAMAGLPGSFYLCSSAFIRGSKFLLTDYAPSAMPDSALTRLRRTVYRSRCTV